MKTIRFSVDGKNTIADINEILSDQEARNSMFLDSKIAYQDGSVVNLVTFELYDDATVPKELTLQPKETNPPPANARQFWEGVMASQNQALVVVAYRAN